MRNSSVNHGSSFADFKEVSSLNREKSDTWENTFVIILVKRREFSLVHLAANGNLEKCNYKNTSLFFVERGAQNPQRGDHQSISVQFSDAVNDTEYFMEYQKEPK